MSKSKLYNINQEERQKRRKTHKRSKCTYQNPNEENKDIELVKDSELTTEHAESRQILIEMTKSFISNIEFYKSEWGGAKSNDEAVKEALQLNEWRRNYVESLEPSKVDWGHISAVSQADVSDGFRLWARLRETAADELESGTRSGKVIGVNAEPYEFAQFLAIRDCFADQWQPTGGIESAMIDMLAISFSLQMYWSTIAHQRAIKVHNDQTQDLNRYERKSWKSPYQGEAEATDQAHRLADGYNRQFLRVLRQLRDLRRYSPIVIQNNGGQVNVGAQQVNVKD